MPRGSSSKRERQYEHIKESAQERGAGTKRAEEMAARTVNKERARTGEASSSRRGGGSRSGSPEPTYEQLYQEAKRKGVKGRSSMNKDELAKHLGR